MGMADSIRTREGRARLIASLTLVFLVGLGFAVAFDGPSGSAAAGARQVAPEATSAVRHASELSQAFVAIAEAVTPAVVRIEAEQGVSVHAVGPDAPIDPRDLFGPRGPDGPRDPRPIVAGGSGVIVSPDGYILTNNHVIADAAALQVVLEDRRRFDARIVGRDPTTDLAVVRIDAEDLPTVSFGDSDAARVGEWVIAIGNPGFSDMAANAGVLAFTVTSGIISAKGRPLDIIYRELAQENDPAARYAIDDFIQTDAVINPGSSGGPLVDLRGRVVGLNTAIASGTGFYQGYGFAIPANLARSIAEDLIEHGYVRRALLGVVIENVTAADAEYYDLPRIAGALIEDFAEDSPARRAGLRRGDVIVEVAGRTAGGVGEVQRLIARLEPGERVPVRVVRAGEARDVTVRLKAAPLPDEPEERMASRAEPADGRRLGIRLDELTDRRAREFGFDRAGGVLVVEVAPMSAAYREGVRPGSRVVSVNGRRIRSAREAQERLRAFQSGQIVSLMLQGPGGQTQIANLRVP